MALTERQKLILTAIIYEYTQREHAVGSKSLQEHLDIKISSATIRNEMAALESDDLIKKIAYFCWSCTIIRRVSLLFRSPDDDTQSD